MVKWILHFSLFTFHSSLFIPPSEVTPLALEGERGWGGEGLLFILHFIGTELLKSKQDAVV
jgi:hypothetical protein